MFKSRSVSRGDLEETTGVRTDSPTCDIELLNLLLSWASCERLTVKSGDITNAYVQGCPLERLILTRQPPGGVPDVDISADTMFVACVPIYGTCDAGRGFFGRNYATGLKENAVLRALYIFQEGGEPKAMLATHVDDMLWAMKPGYDDRVQQLQDRYTIKTVESGTFRLCGREVVQHSDSSISVRCKDTTEKIEPVRYDPKRRKQLDLAREHVIVQLRSVVGSLAWVARQCRPQLSYGVYSPYVEPPHLMTCDSLSNCCTKLRNHLTTVFSSKAAFSPGTKWRCLPLPTLASETSRTSAVKKGRMTFLTA